MATSRTRGSTGSARTRQGALADIGVARSLVTLVPASSVAVVSSEGQPVAEPAAVDAANHCLAVAADPLSRRRLRRDDVRGPAAAGLAYLSPGLA